MGIRYTRESIKCRSRITMLVAEGHEISELTTGWYLKKGYGSVKLSAGETYQARKMWEELTERPYFDPSKVAERNSKRIIKAVETGSKEEDEQ